MGDLPADKLDPTQGGSLTHFDAGGNAVMVDVTAKTDSERLAIARGRVLMQPATAALIRSGGVAKGDVLAVARLAGIMGAKRTSDLIPLCHPLALTNVTIDLTLSPPNSGEANSDEAWVEITAHCKLSGKTGVEMEALTAVSVAALTLYDMCKAVDKGMRLTDIRLIHKSGGKSGSFDAP